MFVSYERAHGVPARPPHPGEPPCPISLQFLNFKDRDAALYLVKTKGEAMKMDNVHIPYYSDFSAELQRIWVKFTKVKKRLRHFDVNYAMLYPASG